MVAAVRTGESLRSVARHFRVGLRTVQRWVARAGDERLDRVDWTDRSRAPRHTRRTALAIEDEVLGLRHGLREESILGEYGAAAIRRALLDAASARDDVPSLRTIGRILERRGALDARRRIRRPPPPPGWYLPDVAGHRVELDEFDVIEGLKLKGGSEFDVLTAISLHGGLCAAWPTAPVRWAFVLEALVGHWRAHGLPAYAQFDNDTRFAGSHGYTDFVSSVMRLCLGLGVAPVFAPPRETGFQAAIESFNGRWQAKVWARVWVRSLAELEERSVAYAAASRSRSAVRIEGAPQRASFPPGWQFDPTTPLSGRIVYLRRTDDRGVARLLGRSFGVNRSWPHRLVRAEVDLTADVVRFYALRRREPTDQPLLREHPLRLQAPTRIRRLPCIGTVTEPRVE
jgi:hypothetical protein